MKNKKAKLAEPNLLNACIKLMSTGRRENGKIIVPLDIEDEIINHIQKSLK